MNYPLIIIGGGLSGLAAGIRFARSGQKVLILEKHSVPGGLNSYYYRHGRLFETGLHAMTNFAPPTARHAPLNRLLRQLKIPRKQLALHEQRSSEILFPGGFKLRFSNNFSQLQDEVAACFPHSIDKFNKFVGTVDSYDPFTPRPWSSARRQLDNLLADELLGNMLLWPLMIYGNSNEHDMDFSQFVIMFRSIFQEGMFRPAGNIKNFLDLLLDHFKELGGEIRFKSEVSDFIIAADRVRGLHLASGEHIACDYLISTAGYPATLKMSGVTDAGRLDKYSGRMSFIESVYLLAGGIDGNFNSDKTIIFYYLNEDFDYHRPVNPLDPNCGVICFPSHFKGLTDDGPVQLRLTHPANYDLWKQATTAEYAGMKQRWTAESREVTAKIIGNYRENIVYQDTFTPVTIERFTSKAQGAIYGSPHKIKDGRTRYHNLFIAGTDQGYLGIVGSMLSGVTMVNQHILGKM